MKKIFILLLMFIIVMPQNMTVHASGMDIDEIFDEQLEVSGAHGLSDALPDDTREQLGDLGITPENGSDWSFEQILDSVAEMTSEAGSEISVAFGLLAALIILASILERVAENTGTETMRKTVSAVVATAACLAVATPVVGYITDTVSSVELCCDFDTVFIPVYSAIIAAAGKTATAAEYSVVMMTVLEATSLLTGNVMLPLLRVILAVSLTSSLSPSLKLMGAVKLFEKYLKWILGFLAMLVVAVMGLSTVTANAMDDITSKAVRFVISSTVPVVGSAMGDALSSVTGCVSLLRTSVGGFGIIAMAFILLPPLIKGALWTLCVNICAVLADMLDVKCVRSIAESVGSVLSVMIAMLIFTGTLTIFTLAVMLGRGA